MRPDGHRRLRAAALALILAAFAVPASANGTGDGAADSHRIAAVLARAARDPALVRIGATDALRRFYEARGDVPAWRRGAEWSPRARLAIAALRGTATDGLEPHDYLAGETGTFPESGEAARADVLLSAGMLRYIGDVRAGRVVPAEIDSRDAVHPVRPDAAAVLAEGLRAADFQGWLSSLPPDNAAYRELRAALPVYREMSKDGPWPKLTDGPTLRAGDSGVRVAALRRQLSRLGDLVADSGPADQFNAALELAVRHFQRRSGLEVDGLVGMRTRAALNVTPEGRTDTITLNLERLRWFKRPPHGRYVVINTAGFELTAFRDGKLVAKMPVIVGTTKRRTPMFNDTITAVTFMPTWTVPPKIAREEILPKVKRDPGYLAKQNMKVYSGWDAASCEVKPGDVDWKSIRPGTLQHRFVQQPGPTNALGRIRFTLHNDFGIFMHDTPAKLLFGKEVRAYSHGCIRVGDAAALADFVLEGDPDWTPEAVRAAMDGGETKKVDLPQPVPVEVTYLTAWVDEAGTVQFRPDVYGRDPRLLRALEAAGDR